MDTSTYFIQNNISLPVVEYDLYKLTPKLLPLIIWPNSTLNQSCDPVDFTDVIIPQLIVDMFRTMKHYKGIGLAAPQVGHLKRLVTIELKENHKFYLINPVIVEHGATQYKHNEGCLSTPGYFEDRLRPQSIIVQHQTLNGITLHNKFEGLYAFAIQHEIDHLNGQVFIDNLSQLKKDRIKSKIKKTLRNRI